MEGSVDISSTEEKDFMFAQDKKRMANFNEEFDNYMRRRKEARKEPAMRLIERKASSLRRNPLLTQDRVSDDDAYNSSSVTTPLTYTEVGR